MNAVAYKSLLDLIKQFPDEKTCHLYLAQQRWITGEIICPHCSHNTCYVFTDGIRYKCKSCKKQFTAKTNTFMGASKLPTIKWILAMYLLMHKKGISSHQLSKDLGVTQKTAWFMLQRIRQAFGKDAEETKLSGTVELDETWIGGKNKNRHYDKKIKYERGCPKGSWPDKVGVVGMLQRGGKLKAVVVGNTTLIKDVARAVLYNVELQSTIMTDEWPGYNKFNKIYNRQKVDHSKGLYVDGDITTNRIENFWSHVKRCIPSIYIAVSKKHTQKYINECAFRYNYRNLAIQQQIETLLSQMECRLLYKQLTAA